MSRARLVFVFSLLLAALLGFCLAWWLRDHSQVSLEQRAHQAVQHVRDAFRSLTH